MIVLDVISWIFLILGSFFSIVGGIGIVRLPEFFSRLHGGGITDTLGAGLIVIGLVFQAPGMLTNAHDATVTVVKHAQRCDFGDCQIIDGVVLLDGHESQFLSCVSQICHDDGVEARA